MTPIVKKSGLDATDVSSYRPISNLSVLSKLLERLVLRQLMKYLTSADLLPPFQSGFRPGYSTETAVLRVLSDILQYVDRGDLAALVLLDLSAAFDTVDHEILLQRLQVTYGIDDTVYRWFQSYLSRSIAVHSLWTFQVVDHPPDMWCATRIGTGTCAIYSLHRRSDLAY